MASGEGFALWLLSMVALLTMTGASVAFLDSNARLAGLRLSTALLIATACVALFAAVAAHRWIRSIPHLRAQIKVSDIQNGGRGSRRRRR